MNSEPTENVLASLNGVSKKFGNEGADLDVIRNVTFEARRGELIVLLGPSGSGKTTILTLMAGLLAPSAGSVLIFGRPICSYRQSELQFLRATRIGFVFQTFLLIDALTVLENVALVVQFGGRGAFEARVKAREVLSRLQIGHLALRFPGTLSQGERQRVAVARAIANNAELLLADEPTASVESSQGLEIIRLLHGYAQERNACVIVASHDLRIIQFADKVLRIEDGCLTHTEVLYDRFVTSF